MLKKHTYFGRPLSCAQFRSLEFNLDPHHKDKTPPIVWAWAEGKLGVDKPIPAVTSPEPQPKNFRRDMLAMKSPI